MAYNRPPVRCKDIQSFHVDDVVELRVNDSWDGPFIIVKFEFSEATDNSLCSAHVELRRKLPSKEEPQLADPMEDEETEEIEIIAGELPTIRKVILPEAKQRFTIKRADS